MVTRQPAGGDDGPPGFRLVTYNVRRCLGIDGILSVQRIADVIAECEADVIALQELDVGRSRSAGVDQAGEIARLLGIDTHFFHPAWMRETELYGDAILTRLPARLVRAAALPTPGLIRREPRGAVWVEVEAGGVPVQVLNTHFGLGFRERVAQARAILGPDWLGGIAEDEPVVLAGDLNSMPGGPAYRSIAARLVDVPAGVGCARPTFPTGRPVFRIDHVFASRALSARRAEVVASPLARLASDHRPISVDLVLSPRTAGPT